MSAGDGAGAACSRRGVARRAAPAGLLSAEQRSPPDCALYRNAVSKESKRVYTCKHAVIKTIQINHGTPR